jgi:ParB family transcriptional regulator, chromosome partitioning protein
MAKPKGLGRGLDALLGDSSSSTSTQQPDTLRDLEVNQLQPGKYQPRAHMDQASLTALADSIKSQGVMQPIIVRKLQQNGYEIIAGERRWRAAQIAGLKQVPVVIREVADEAALAMALIENIQREDLNPIEEALGIQRLINEFAMTHEGAAEAVGRSRSAVSNLLRLLNLPKTVQDMVLQGTLDMGHARALLPLATAKQLEAAHEITHKGLSVREAEKLVAKLLKPEVPKKHLGQDRDTLRLQEDLAEKLGAKVTIKHDKKGAGQLIIDYADLAQLDGLIQRINRE